jgi:surface carbohydrate biosynthesis protein
MLRVYLPLEIYSREYTGKLALASELLKSDVEIIMGYNLGVRAAVLNDCESTNNPSGEGAVYYEIKGQSLRGMEHLNLFSKAGITIVGQDEEAGISYSNFQDFITLRPETKGLDLYDAYFAYGEVDYRSYTLGKNLDKVHLTGSPRLSFWGELGKEFYKENISEARNRYGEFVLVASNTTVQNRIMSLRQMKKIPESLGYSKHYKKTNLKIRGQWEKEAFQVTVDSVKEILQSTDLNILIRPHPVEDQQIWIDKFAYTSRVFVDKSGPVTPIILAAKSVIHTGSTVGLESIICEIPTISLRGLITRSWFTMLPDEYSHQPSSWEELSRLLNNDLVFKNDRSQFRKYLSFCGTLEAIEKQTEIILNLPRKNRVPIPKTKSSLNYLSFLMRIIDRIRFGKSATGALNINKRPVITLAQFQCDLTRMNGITGNERDFNIQEIEESTFRVTNVK